jgi:uncharacterized protein (DUF58 family)
MSAPTARYGTPRLRAYVGFTAVGLLGGLFFGRPELVALAAPFAVVVAVGLVWSRAPDLEVSSSLGAERVVQGDRITLTVTITSAVGVPRVEVRPVIAPGVAAPADAAQAVRLMPDEPATISATVVANRWGTFGLGAVEIRAFDRFGLVHYDGAYGRPTPLKVLPDAGTLRTLINPIDTQIFSGDLVSRRRGDGIEFSDVRAFVPGDRMRDVNWRATARSERLYVNQRLAERNADIVIFVDTFDDLRRAATDTGSLDVAVSAAASAATAYLRRRDRVGLVGWGGYLQWLAPSMGQLGLYRIVDTLLDARVVRSDAQRGIRILPAGVLPPGALILALTPLLDPRTVNALFDLKARGTDVAIVELDPTTFQSPGRRPQEQLAHRLWRLSRERVRLRFEGHGVVVVVWDGQRPFDEVVREVEACRARFRRRSG